jgi:hypothetical protein
MSVGDHEGTVCPPLLTRTARDSNPNRQIRSLGTAGKPASSWKGRAAQEKPAVKVGPGSARRTLTASLTEQSKTPGLKAPDSNLQVAGHTVSIEAMGSVAVLKATTALARIRASRYLVHWLTVNYARYFSPLESVSGGLCHD